MKRSWTALAVALISVLAVAGCNDYGNTFQNNTGASVTFLSPSNISAGSGSFTITVNGTGFVTQTYITWNGKKLTTTDTLDTAGNVINVMAVVPADLVAKPGTATVITQNPFSGAGNNGLSNPITFIINPPPNPVPTLSAIVPTSIAACGSSCASASFTLDVQGTNFITSSTDPTQVSQVRWTSGATQTTVTTTSVTATDIKATVPGSLYSSAGSAAVTVFNPPAPQTTPTGGTPNAAAGGGGTSGAQTFTITAPEPGLAHAQAGESVVEETPAVSSDGRYVAYTASQNEHTDIFLRDTCEGAPSGCKPQTTVISAASDGNAADGDSNAPSISANGRYVAFTSAASNLVENSPAGRQIFLRDTCSGAAGGCSPTTQIISTDTSGALAGADSLLPSISASGRFVAFLAVTGSHASTSASSEKNSGYRQVFVRDTCLGVTGCTPKTTRISLQPSDGASTTAKRAGPALAGGGKSIALAGQSATLFTRSVAIDDRVFLAITNSDK
jgi:hypothetical protein